VAAAKRGQQSQHVVRSDGGWSVKRAGATKASRTFSTQSEAVSYGKTVARNSKSELFIHGTDGRIRERNSYGHDPHPPKG
jgi:hypothetical protein